MPRLKDRRFRHDAAYKRAKEEGFAGRAVYKLQDLDQKFRLFKPEKRVLDLGCWPGSWLQYIGERVGENGLAVGVDLRETTISLASWVHPFVGDVHELDTQQLVETWGKFDVVVSDMAPGTTGDRHTDQWKSEELFLRALEIATEVLRPGGHFAGKVFQGGRFKVLSEELSKHFQLVKAYHPKNTRSQSFEQYLTGRGFRGAKSQIS